MDNISRDDIQKLGVGSIGRLDISAPCKDFAMSRLLPCRWGGKLNDPRPGLRGKYGKVLLTCLEVTTWVLELNPNCEFFCENLPFTDIVADWKVMCLALGQPVVLDSADYSCTRRTRAYWTNMRLPSSREELTRGFSPVEPNQYMGEGRTLEPYFVDGKTTVRTIGASWTGDENHPKADTKVPVNVYDQRYEQAQPLNVEEAELLMGFPAGSTSGQAVTPISRLQAVGDSWDVRTALMLNRFSRHATIKVDGPIVVRSLTTKPSPVNLSKQALLAARAKGGPAAVVQLLSELTIEEQLMLLQYVKAPASQVFYAGSVLDSGSSKHLHKDVQVTQSDDLCSISGLNSDTSPTWTQGNGYLPLTARDNVSGQDRSFDVGTRTNLIPLR